jgi:hypothetical protein
MKVRYRVIHKRKTIWQALIQGRTWTDWYVAQRRGWFGWRTLGVFGAVAEAEQACADHAGGELLDDGGRIVSEFTRRDED